jgi:hypothetical protein
VATGSAGERLPLASPLRTLVPPKIIITTVCSRCATPAGLVVFGPVTVPRLASMLICWGLAAERAVRTKAMPMALPSGWELPMMASAVTQAVRHDGRLERTAGTFKSRGYDLEVCGEQIIDLQLLMRVKA